MKSQDLVAVLRERADRDGDRTALQFQGEVTRYGELDRQTDQVAQALEAAGARAGSRIGILSRNHAAQVSIWFGALKCGAVLVPVNYRLVASELTYIFAHAEIEVLFVGRDHYAVAQAMLARLPTVRQVVAIDGGHPSWPSFTDWRDRHPARPVAHQVSPEEVALQIYTSGTTGRPKGVELTHQGMIADLHRNAAHGYWREGDVLLMCMPMCHLGGSLVTTRCFYFGMEMLLVDGFVPEDIIRDIERHRVNKIFFVPSMLHMLLETPACHTADLSSLDLVFYGAGVMSHELLSRSLQVFRCGFASGFGMTETCGAVTNLSPEDHRGALAAQRMKSCGRPDGAQVRVVDENGQHVPAGVVGEIICRTPQIMRGYFRQPQDTAAALRDGWMHTGDAGYFDADGYLYVSDRIKDMIKSGGINIYPRELEEVLLAHPGIREVAVIGVPDARWDESVKAIVVPRPGHALTARDVIDFCQGRMAKFKIPRSVDFAQALPRNAVGKVLKRELRARYAPAALAAQPAHGA